jgi:uncharacterized radical SAM protein YgiQ
MNPPPSPSDFLPTTFEEVRARGWDGLDVILVTGDTYIDSPYLGAAVIGRVLADAGYRVGIIAQPDMDRTGDIARLGEPTLFWGVTGGSVDSLVANRTALGKPRRQDDLTPGGRNDRRPDRAVIVYTNLIRRRFKQTRPIVLGGIEASLRRISHYDAWSDKVRRSVLFDAKADVLVYGMAEKSILEVAGALEQGADMKCIRGICYISAQMPAPCDDFPGPDVLLPAHARAAADNDAFSDMFRTFYAHIDPRSARRLIQQQDTRYLVHNPPAFPLTPTDLDRVYELPFTSEVHPFYAGQGAVKALETIQFALTTHRGCYGECRFCAIAVHQGRQVVSRSRASLLREAARLTRHARFKGIIADVGGPTANMYGFECRRKASKGACPEKSCLYPRTCDQLAVNHQPQLELLRDLRQLPGVRKVFVRSGLRHDLVLADGRRGRQYLQTLLRHHVSGQLKIAPEHVEEQVLQCMGKPGRESLEAFLDLFRQVNRDQVPKAFLTYYLLAAHPGCTLEHMRTLRKYALGTLGLLSEQVQIFTPTPSTFSTLMYHTRKDPFTRTRIFVERNSGRKQAQKEAVLKRPDSRRRKRNTPYRKKKTAKRYES